jgi:glutaminyl-peptide cyclotransferase
MVGDKDLEILKEEGSSKWLVDAIWATARHLGFTKEFPNRSFSIGGDDHIPFLQAGIPAVDLIDFDYGDDQHDFWHTKDDTLDKLSPRSLKIVGDVVILSLPQIESQIR